MARNYLKGLLGRLDIRRRLLEPILRELQQQAERLDSLEPRVDHVAETTSCLEGLHGFKIQEVIGLLRYIRRRHYCDDIRAGLLPVPQLHTRHPVAVHTADTRHPRGAKNDNSICLRFNQRLYDLIGDDGQTRVLDLGCAGGGFVRSVIDDGHLAVGLEGADYPKLVQKDEWSTIPHHLHTCDVTEPFLLTYSGTGEIVRFHAITAWELLEHIHRKNLPELLRNIRAHLAEGGYLLCSIATFEDWDEQKGCVYHQTVRPREWWLRQFRQAGLVAVDDTGIGKNDWLRGSGNCWGDWHEDEGLGFHVAARLSASGAQQAREDRRWLLEHFGRRLPEPNDSPQSPKRAA